MHLRHICLDKGLGYNEIEVKQIGTGPGVPLPCAEEDKLESCTIGTSL